MQRRRASELPKAEPSKAEADPDGGADGEAEAGGCGGICVCCCGVTKERDCLRANLAFSLFLLLLLVGCCFALLPL